MAQPSIVPDEGGHQKRVSSEVLRGHQRSSEASFEAIGGMERVLKVHERPFDILSEERAVRAEGVNRTTVLLE
jgi:hypothetical protein